MELKEVIMSTLAELESVEEVQEVELDEQKSSLSQESTNIMEMDSTTSNEKQFYENIRERILVLFEGFQSPNNKNIEAKVDLTLNFLEYLLATIDERLESFNTSSK
ncbi:MAG: hypothetical protein GXP61_01525 [Epsilonproteobacteria bacterium]|nr:hypothetical protein [Campylobacterota bacterium]